MGIRITNLPDATVVNNADVLPIVQDGVTKQAQRGLVKTTNASELTSGTVATARLPVSTTSAAGVVQLGNVTGTACEGNDPRLSDSRIPTGSAGGDLAGSYPNPTIATLSPSPAGTYGSSASLPVLQVNAKGQVTSVGSITLASSATTDATNASNISSGTLSAARLPALTGDVTTSSGSAATTLSPSGVAAGVYGSPASVPQITIDAKGRVVTAANVGISGSAGGTVTSVGINSSTLSVANTPITFTGNIDVDLPATGVTPGTVGSSTQIPVITADAQGRITALGTAFVSSLTTQEVAALTTSQLSAISVSAGAGLVGGGNISANSTLSLATLSPNPVGTYGNGSSYPVITVDEYGRTTAISTQPVPALGVTSFSGGTTGFTPSTGTTGAVTLGGTLGFANGGTGATSQQAALNAVAGGVTSGQYLRGNGTNVSLSALQVADLSGTVAVNQGGTGATSLTGYVKGTGTSALTGSSTVPATDLSGTLQSAQFPALTGDVTTTAGSLATVIGNISAGVNVRSLREVTTFITTAATAYNVDALTQAVVYVTANSIGAFTVNVRASSTQTLASYMSTGQSLTIVFMATQGATPTLGTLQIDGATITTPNIRWINGTAPSAGNANSIDIYTYTIVRTSTGFTAFASQNRFA